MWREQKDGGHICTCVRESTRLKRQRQESPAHEGSDGPMSKDLWNGGSLLMHDRPPVWGYASSASQVRQGLIPCMTSAQRFKSPHDVMEG